MIHRIISPSLEMQQTQRLTLPLLQGVFNFRFPSRRDSYTERGHQRLLLVFTILHQKPIANFDLIVNTISPGVKEVLQEFRFFL